jgi:hypothetical protein
MPKRCKAKSLKKQSQKKQGLTLQDIEENSIDQLMTKPSPALMKTLKKMLGDNNEEIASLTNLNKKILECLDRIDQQDEEANIGVASEVYVVLQNSSKVSLISLIFVLEF